MRTPARRLARLSLLLLSLLAAAGGCTSWSKLPDPRRAPAYKFTLGPGDVLEVAVWREAEMQRKEVTIAPDGTVLLPLAGQVMAAGLTPDALATRFTEKLKEFYQEPAVVLGVARFASPRVHVVGEVTRPGTYPYAAGLSAAEVVVLAGSYNPVTADIDEVRIVRGRLSDPRVFRVDLEEVLEAKEKDAYLEPGDIVYVPPTGLTTFERVVGQVLSPLRQLTGTAREAAGTMTAP